MVNGGGDSETRNRGNEIDSNDSVTDSLQRLGETQKQLGQKD